MKVDVRYLAIPIVALAIVVIAAALFTTLAGSGAAPVEVQNVPLLVTLQNTRSVTGTVSATQSGTWNFGVTSLPAVQVSSSLQAPVFTANEESAKHAFLVVLCHPAIDFCSTPSATTQASLPVGPRFVIEQISGQCRTTEESQSLLSPRLNIQLNGQAYYYYVSSQLHGNLGRVFNNETTIYADGSLSMVSLSNEACAVTLSGRLVQLPTFPSSP